MSSVNGAKGLKLVILDACRNNPFIESMRVTSRSRSIGRGLAPVDTPEGTYVSYSAEGNTVAEDGQGRNSPFTTALLKHIEEPNLEVDKLFRKVRDEVVNSTGGRQKPFTYGSLPGTEVYLKRTIQLATTDSRDEREDEIYYWNSVKDSGNKQLIGSYLSRYPKGRFAEIAKIMMDDPLGRNSGASDPIKAIAEQIARQLEERQQRQEAERKAAEKQRLEAGQQKQEPARQAAEEQERQAAELKRQEEARKAAEEQERQAAELKRQEEARKAAEKQVADLPTKQAPEVGPTKEIYAFGIRAAEDPENGILVRSVHNDGVSANKIDRGDRITGVNGRAVGSIAVLEEFARDAVFDKSNVALDVLKPTGAKVSVKILANNPAYRATVGDFTGEVGAYLRETENGLLVTYVGEDTPAGRANLAGGDLIVEINGKGVSRVGDLARAVGEGQSASYELTVASVDPNAPDSDKVESRLVTLTLPKEEVETEEVEPKEPEQALGKHKKKRGQALGKRKGKSQAARPRKIESKPAPQAEKPKKTPKSTVSKPPAKKKSRPAVTYAPPPVQSSAPRRGGGGGSLVLP
jgi:C-terminal processing protease CtpA/Prc